MRKITLNQLEAAGACEKELTRIRKRFGLSVEITEEWCLANAMRFDWRWATRLLSRPARAEYARVCASASTEYVRVCESALAEYDRVCVSALAEYERVCAPALLGRARVRVSARAEYERVCASALLGRARVRVSAWAEYVRTCAPAWARAYIADKEVDPC